MGCRVCAGKVTPYAGMASLAANSAPWTAVVPVLCGPMCSRRVPSRSEVNPAPFAVTSGFVQSVSMARGR